MLDTWLSREQQTKEPYGQILLAQGNLWGGGRSLNNTSPFSDLADLTLRQKKTKVLLLVTSLHSYLERFHGKFAHLPEMEAYMAISKAKILRRYCLKAPTWGLMDSIFSHPFLRMLKLGSYLPFQILHACKCLLRAGLSEAPPSLDVSVPYNTEYMLG